MVCIHCKHFNYIRVCVFRGGKMGWLREWVGKTTYWSSFEERKKKIKNNESPGPTLFALRDVLLVLALKNCLNFLSIKTKRGNNCQAKCVSWNRLHNSAVILTCSFTSRAAKWIWCFFFASFLFLRWVLFPLFRAVLWYLSLLLQIRPTWTGTPRCAYFLLARATTWHGVCDGEEVLTENRHIAAETRWPRFTSFHSWLNV